METDLEIRQSLVLPPELEYTEYSTKNVTNHIEVQTQEKAFVKYTANSSDSSTLTFNLPSISGGAMVRELELEIPIKFSIKFKATAPATPNFATAPVVSAATAATLTYGSSPRPFMTELNCLDSFPLSKIFSSREYTINNSSTILKEDFTPEQIDVMASQLDMRKVENAGLCLFADANSHFRSLSAETGGLLLPLAYTTSAASSIPIDAMNDWRQAFETNTAGTSSLAMPHLLNPATKYAVGICNSWQQKRNTARNIVSSSMTVALTGTETLSDKIVGYGGNAVIVGHSDASGNATQCVRYIPTEKEYFFTIVVREQLLSQFFDNEYSYNKFSWNKLLPASSLNLKFTINSKYLQEAVLKIGDNIASMQSSNYVITTPTLGDFNECYLYVKQCKIPLALLPNESYKILYYAQERPQANKDINYQGNGVWSSEMQYANLSQVPEYLLIYLPIRKTSFIGTVPETPTGTSTYNLPSTFNLPITQLQLTFNQDSNLATYGLDMRQLQQFTMENIQNFEGLKDLVVGKSGCINRSPTAGKTSATIVNNTSAQLTTALDVSAFIHKQMSAQLGAPIANDWTKTNGISNSSFYLLKLGTQIRLPEGYSSSMIVNYNLTVKATCDINSPYLRSYGDCLNDIKHIASGPTPQNLKGHMDVVHFNKRILTLSGVTLSNIYTHNVQITSSEYLALRKNFMDAFRTDRKREVFNVNMMIGGGFFSNLKNEALTALKWLAPKVRTVVDIANKYLPEGTMGKAVASFADTGLRHFGAGKYEDEMEGGGIFDLPGDILHGIENIGSDIGLGKRRGAGQDIEAGLRSRRGAGVHDIEGGKRRGAGVHDIEGGKRRGAGQDLEAGKKKMSVADWKKYVANM